jgi:hypothetical protein
MSEPETRTPRELHDQYSAFLQRKLAEAELHLAEIERDRDATRGMVKSLTAAIAALGPLPTVVPDIADGGDEFGQGEGSPGTHYDRIRKFLGGQHDPCTIAEIEAGTGISRSSVSAVLYRTHTEAFQRCERGGNLPNTWSLVPPPPVANDFEIPF